MAGFCKHGNGHYYFLQSDDVQAVTYIPMFRMKLLYASTKKMKAADSSKTFVNIYKTIRHHIPEDSLTCNHCNAKVRPRALMNLLVA